MRLTALLRPGDCLLYRPTSLFGRLVALKTWHAVSHVEVYAGSGQSFASRDGQGVDLYPLRLDGLRDVLRPVTPFDLAQAAAWFAAVRGQKYDWWGLFRFFTIGRGKPDRMFCSELATRLYRHSGIEPFQPDEDADLVAPFEFLLSPAFVHYVVNGSEVTPSVVVEGA